MKIRQLLTSVLWGAIASLAPVMTGIAEAKTNLFGAKDLAAGDVVAIAVPIDNGESYNLLILEQLGSSRDCWREQGNVPTVVDPLLLNFDFTNICARSTDSNGYSLRLAGEEMSWRYSFRLVKEGNDLKLKAFDTQNSGRSPIEVGSTQGITAGMLKIQLNEGWRMAKRTYEGKALGHIYLVNDQSVNQFIASAPVENDTFTLVNTANSTVKPVAQVVLGSEQIFMPPVNNDPVNNDVAPVTSFVIPRSPTPVTEERTIPVLAVPNKPIPNSVIAMSPPPPPTSTSLAMTLGLKYRVVVDAQSPSQKDVIKSIVPDAFNTWVGDRRMMQVGAYADETEAQAMQARLSQSGLAAQILPVR